MLSYHCDEGHAEEGWVIGKWFVVLKLVLKIQRALVA
jgi:hypothetical protein